MNATPLTAALSRNGTRPFLARFRSYLTLIKSLQTGLLLVTGAAGYISACCLNLKAGSLGGLVGSLFLAVSGSTILNMAFDRDIDARMARTSRRPLPAGQVKPAEVWGLGLAFTASGLAWAAFIDIPYAAVVLAGVFFDVVIYTVLLKRRTPFSILIGGLAGGMPALAGRVLAAGRVDGAGLLLALGILLWIPTHILTFTIKYREDYACAGVPTFPEAIGIAATRRVIAISSLLTSAALFAAGELIGLPSTLLAALGLSGLLLAALAFGAILRPEPRIHFVLYKGASIYMLAAMLLFIAGGL